ncbi:MAG: hypothetical protein WAR57_10360 [Candidatus Phosphoribacter sp.]|nr:hypothetical protein [Actinomycetales bacterium]
MRTAYRFNRTPRPRTSGLSVKRLALATAVGIVIAHGVANASSAGAAGQGDQRDRTLYAASFVEPAPLPEQSAPEVALAVAQWRAAIEAKVKAGKGKIYSMKSVSYAASMTAQETATAHGPAATPARAASYPSGLWTVRHGLQVQQLCLGVVSDVMLVHDAEQDHTPCRVETSRLVGVGPARL